MPIVHPSFAQALWLACALTLATADAGRAQAVAAPPPPPPGWTGSIGGGFALTKGNSDTSTGNIGFDVLRDHGTNVLFRSSGLYLSGSNNGRDNVDRSQADVRIDYRLTPRLSTFALTTFARDRYKAIEFMVAPTGGLSYKVLDTERADWLTDVSVGAVIEKNRALGTNASGAVVVGEKLDVQIAERTRFVHAASGLWKVEDLDNAYYTFSAGLLTSIAGNFDLKTEYLGTYKNRPTNPGLVKADQSIVLSVVYRY